MNIKFIFRIRPYIKLARKIISLFVTLRAIPNPILYMTLLVKDEEDIIEQNLLFHKAMGVDGFIVTDNNSIDGTVDILAKYKEKGWIKELIDEPGNNYDQKKWVDRMIRIARNKYNADWIINADADEFWYTPLKDLKKELEETRYNIISCPLVNVVPENDKPLELWHTVVANPIKDLTKLGLSKYAVYNIQFNKVIHRAHGYIDIYTGNHNVEMFPEKKSDKSNITIYHYPVRHYSRFLTKVKNGGEAMRNNSNKSLGTHWQDLYNIYLRGNLKEEYDKIIGRSYIDTFSKQGIVKYDDMVFSILRQISIKKNDIFSFFAFPFTLAFHVDIMHIAKYL